MPARLPSAAGLPSERADAVRLPDYAVRLPDYEEVRSIAESIPYGRRALANAGALAFKSTAMTGINTARRRLPFPTDAPVREALVHHCGALLICNPC